MTHTLLTTVPPPHTAYATICQQHSILIQVYHNHPKLRLSLVTITPQNSHHLSHSITQHDFSVTQPVSTHILLHTHHLTPNLPLLHLLQHATARTPRSPALGSRSPPTPLHPKRKHTIRRLSLQSRHPLRHRLTNQTMENLRAPHSRERHHSRQRPLHRNRGHRVDRSE